MPVISRKITVSAHNTKILKKVKLYLSIYMNILSALEIIITKVQPLITVRIIFNIILSLKKLMQNRTRTILIIHTASSWKNPCLA